MRPATIAGMALAGLVIAWGAQAAPVYWTDWTSANVNAQAASGTLTVGATTVGVTYSGEFNFALTSGGFNYWTPATTYQGSGVDNAPPDADIIGLSIGGAKTITFSQAVVDPIIALVSWNDNTVDFGTPIDVLQTGPGYWGSGTLVVNATGTGFYGDGDVNGLIRLPGTFTSITFTDTTETWHGFTVGVTGLAGTPPPPPTGVPAPAPLAVLATGLLALAGVRRLTRA